MPELSLFSVLVTFVIAGLVLAGCVWTWRRGRRAPRVRHEDVLKHLCKVEAGGRRPTLQSVAGALRMPAERAAAVLREMELRQLVSFASGDLQLTADGRKAGLHIVRAHRLWECYLADQTGLRERDWHARAERREHLMSPEEADHLAFLLGNPTHDPHGDPIPTADGVLEPDAGRPLVSLSPGESAVLAHLEDEPANLYAQLVAHGLRAGMTLKMLEKNGQSVRFVANGDAFDLPPILANQIEVRALEDLESDGAELGNLAGYGPGSRVRVAGLARSCRGQERRRLLDLGFVAGTEVVVAMVSPSGEPTAYQVRGALIALHREQARQVMVRTDAEVAA